MKFEQMENQFASMRCEQILKNKDRESEEKIVEGIKGFKNSLDESQAERFIQCLDEINIRNAKNEESIYSTAFGDGIIFVISHLIKNKII